MSSSLYKKCIFTIITTLFFTSFSFAGKVDDKVAVDKITAKMSMRNIQVTSVSPFIVEGLYEVLTDRGVYYVSKNAQFLVQGNIYDLDNRMENISEKSLMALRKSKLKTFEKEMIIYKAPQEKHVVTIFTDTSCGYCQKLHSEMADYNRLGITVRYLAFPRGGINSATYNSMVSIWCADDQKLAMDNAKKRREIEYKTCKNTIKEQYELGVFFGVNGTPAIILEDGSMQPGYVPAESLIMLLDRK